MCCKKPAAGGEAELEVRHKMRQSGRICLTLMLTLNYPAGFYRDDVLTVFVYFDCATNLNIDVNKKRCTKGM